MLSKLVSVIVSTKDRLPYLIELIDSIQKNTENYEIIIVDDCSKDDTAKWLRGNKDIISIINPISIPVADAWNMGATVANGKYLVFLNDDMEVTAGWVEPLIEFVEKHPEVGVLSSQVIDDQGLVQSRGHIWHNGAFHLPPEDNRIIDYAPHPFVKKSLYDAVEGFTPHAQMYYEDVDFGLKAQAKGRINYYVPDSIIIHRTVGARIGTDEQRKIREHNENVIQVRARESFMKSWANYLK